jgi:hypothetical protein
MRSRRAGRQGPRLGVGVDVRGDEDHGKIEPGGDQGFAQLEAAHARHADVRDQAIALGGHAGEHESGAGRKGADLESDGP